MNSRKLIKQFGISPDFEVEPMNNKFGADDPARVEEFEKLLGKRLPEDYRLFVTHLAPCMFGTGPDFRPLELNPWMEEGNPFCDFGIFHGFCSDGGFNDLIEGHTSRKSRLPSGMFVIGDSDGGDLLMSLNDPPGRIYFQERNTFEDLRKILYLCANSFTEFLKSFELRPEEEEEEDSDEDDGLIEDLDAYEKEEERKEREREKNVS